LEVDLADLTTINPPHKHSSAKNTDPTFLVHNAGVIEPPVGAKTPLVCLNEAASYDLPIVHLILIPVLEES